MNETSFIHQIKSIQAKLQSLLQNQAMLLKENKKLSLQLEKTTEQNQVYLKKIEALETEISLKKYFSKKLSKEENKAMRKTIDGYIAAIEKCLLALNG